jgi:2,4-diaminopentanoate dehydrogenase
VTAIADIDSLLAVEPDCVSYMPYRPGVDHVVRMFESGSNLVLTPYMLSGVGYTEDAADRIRLAAKTGRSSLYTSGIYPGHVPA